MGILPAHSGGSWRGARWAPRRGIPAQRSGASARVPWSALREVAGDGPTCTPAHVPLDPGARVASAIASGTARLFRAPSLARVPGAARVQARGSAQSRSPDRRAQAPPRLALSPPSTGPRFTFGASSGRNASPWRYVAMPARRLSTRAPSPCSLGRRAMAVASTTRVAGRLACCSTGNRGTWLQSTPPCAGGDIRVPHWIDGERQIMPPRARLNR